MPRAYLPPEQETLRWVARHVHPRARVSSVTPLVGGITADMDRVTVESPTGPRDLVLRRWPAEEEDGLVAREASALLAVRGHDVPAPELVAADEDGSEAGVRCTLTTALGGEPDLSPADLHSWLGQLAAAQAAIHAVPEPRLAPWEGWRDDSKPLDWIEDSGLRTAAREAASEPLADDDPVLMHGDYQHFNVLWRNGRLSGVVDWPHASTGNRGIDVGHCRLNLAVLFGPTAAAEYLVAYESAAGVSVDRRADLAALLRFDLEWQQFIPHQVAGRAQIDVSGMPGRVAATVRDALDEIG